MGIFLIGAQHVVSAKLKEKEFISDMLFKIHQDTYRLITLEDRMFLLDFGYGASLVELERELAISRVYLGDLSGVILFSVGKVLPKWLSDFKGKYPWVNLYFDVIRSL